jgi:DNA polymerase (family 10)
VTNRELAALFDELAEIMEIAGENHFKIRAYRNASGAISSSLDKISEMPVEKLQQIAGIGKAISEKIQAANKMGTFPALEKWRQSGFASLRPLLGIPDFSLRKLRAMIKALDIASIDDLNRPATDGRLSSYDKLDLKTREKIKWMAKTLNEPNPKS